MTAAAAYRRDIDGLRALAVISVIGYHAFPKALSGGFIGVDIFFVISGYLISSLLFNALQTDQFSSLDFYQKRARRLLPALILVLSITLVFGYFTLFTEEYENLAKHTKAGTRFISNLVLWKESNYFDKPAELKPLLHLWSLGIEEQFYLIWPIFLLFFWKRPTLILVIASIMFASFVLNIGMIHHHAGATFYLPFTRFWGLLAGCLLATYGRFPDAKFPGQRILRLIGRQLQRHGLSTQSTAHVTALIAILLLLCATGLLNRTYLYPGWAALIPTLCALILISSKDSWVNQTLLSHPVAVSIGLISYPLYLWHWPILAFGHIIFGDPIPLSITWLLLLGSLLLATLTYFWLEKPIRLQTAYSIKYVVVILLLMLTVLLVVSNYIEAHHGLHERRMIKEHSALNHDLIGFEDYRKTTEPCTFTQAIYKDLTWCLQSKPGAPNKALFGDSHADHLFPGLIAQDPDNNWLLIGNSSCPPLLNVHIYQRGTVDVCLIKNKAALDAIVNSPSIETVILASLGPFYVSDTSFAAQHTGDSEARFFFLKAAHPEPRNTSKAAVFYHGLDETISALEKAGKNVVLFQDVPELPFMPEHCIKRPLAPTAFHCSIEKKLVIQRQTDYRAILLKLQKSHPNVRVFNSTRYLCNKNTCSIKAEAHFIYRDSHHLSLYGSNLITKSFLTWLDNEPFMRSPSHHPLKIPLLAGATYAHNAHPFV